MRWTPEKLEQFKTLWAKQERPEDMAQAFGVTASAIHSKARTLGLSRERAWTAEEDQALIADWVPFSLGDLAQRFLRNEGAITKRGQELGLPNKTKPKGLAYEPGSDGRRQVDQEGPDLALMVRRDQERTAKALEAHQGRGTPCGCGCGRPIEAALAANKAEGAFSVECQRRIAERRKASDAGMWWVRPGACL